MNTPAAVVEGPGLLPCPFCGRQPHVYEDGLTLHCGCGVYLSDYSTEKLVASWNCRSQGWRPIESAPRGVRVLVWGQYEVAFSTPDVGAFTAWVEVNGKVYLDPTAHNDEYPDEELVGVTHWMPLPAPPTPDTAL